MSARSALRARRGLWIGACLAGTFASLALLSVFWTPYPVDGIAVDRRLMPPDLAHPLGTDHLGRDLLSMVLAGSVTSLGVAFIAVTGGLAVGVPLGLLAARGGLFDGILMRGADVVFAFPALLSAVLITAVLGPSVYNAIIAIAVFNVPVFARVARAGALGLASREYLMAARLAGKGWIRVTYEHVLPNIASVLVVQATIQFPLGILAEAGLSYVGLGAQPPTVSWGRMLFEAQTLMGVAPRLALVPGFVIVVTVVGLNLLGDGLRDAFDPRLGRHAFPRYDAD